MQQFRPTEKQSRTMTLEAFADTIVPGEKRSEDDWAIAGAATGDGAVTAGAIELLEWDATGVAGDLADLANRLNEHARAYIDEHGLALDPRLPSFVSLAFEHRTALVRRLLSRGHPEREFWVLLTLFSNMAFDAAAHLHTAEAIAAGHPGLLAMGMAEPDPDGLLRFPEYSYRDRLAVSHPDTTLSGSPA